MLLQKLDFGQALDLPYPYYSIPYNFLDRTGNLANETYLSGSIGPIAFLSNRLFRPSAILYYTCQNPLGYN